MAEIETTPISEVQKGGKFQKGHIPWNKGMKDFIHSGSFKEGHSQSNTGRTHFQKGCINSPKASFQKNHVPFNKGYEFARLNTSALKNIKLKLSSLQCAYLAGFLDSDGNICIGKSNGHYRLSLTFYNCDKGALEIMQGWIGFGVVRARKKRNENWNINYYLKYTSARAAKIIKRLYPFLLVKKDQAEIVMEFLETFYKENYEGGWQCGGRKLKKGILEKRQSLKERLQSLTGTANYLGKNYA